MTDRKVAAHSDYRRSCKSAFAAFRIDGLEPLGEPVVDKLEQFRPLTGSALIAQQPREARGGA